MGVAIIAALGAYLAFKYLSKPAEGTTAPVNTGDSSAVAPNQVTDNMLKNPVEVAGTTARPPECTSCGAGSTTTTGSPTAPSSGIAATSAYSKAVYSTSTTSYPVSSSTAGTTSGTYNPDETRETLQIAAKTGQLYY